MADTPPATPRRLLTRHFISRLFDNDLLSPEADAHRGASLGLASLLSVGAFVSVLSGARFVITPFPMPALNAVGAIDDALLFISLSMILLAIVAVVAWDGLALDARDEAILGPLPIPRATIVGAKLAAMGALAGAVLLALNGPSSVLHASAVVAQLRISVPGALRLMLAHAIACGGAGAFGFCTVLALREVCRAALGPVVAGGVDAPAGAADRRAGHDVPADARLDGTRRRTPRSGVGRLAYVGEPADVVRRPAPGARRPRRGRHPDQADADARPGHRGSVGGALRPRAAGRRSARAHGARRPGRIVRGRGRRLPVERAAAGGARPHAAARPRGPAIPLGAGDHRHGGAHAGGAGRLLLRHADVRPQRAASRGAGRRVGLRPGRGDHRLRPRHAGARRRRRDPRPPVDADDVHRLPARRLRAGDAAAGAPAGLLERQARLARRRPRLRRRRQARHGAGRRRAGARAPAARPAVVPPAAAGDPALRRRPVPHAHRN